MLVLDGQSVPLTLKGQGLSGGGVSGGGVSGGGFKLNLLPDPKSRMDRIIATKNGPKYTTQLSRLQMGKDAGLNIVKSDIKARNRPRRKKK